MSILHVNKLVKKYPSFELKEISFDLEAGKITGFIGRNGAGKTTAIKSILNLVHPDSGEIYFREINLKENEAAVKKRIGYSSGSINWYPRKKLKSIAQITSSFYDTWDEALYEKYLQLFGLDENKTPIELSEGMKVKFNIALALSHKAELLILDEPTSGLDPFSRSELLDLFSELKSNGTSIFFSTHIISDIESCAENIIYISNGKIAADLTKEDFVEKLSETNENLEQTFLRLERGVRNE